MRRSYETSIGNSLLEAWRKAAKHGDFFFADYYCATHDIRFAPVFVIGGDNLDVIVCGCTSQPSKSPFDVGVQLMKWSYVRTNKIYTIPRTDLEFPIHQKATDEQYRAIMDALRCALRIS